jgi:DNA-binding CsgD family transcriptional regulator
MSAPLTDRDLCRLKLAGTERACENPSVLALLAHVIARHPRRKIHWLPADSEEVLAGWIAARLLHGRLAELIDRSSSIKGLCAGLVDDLQQYANDERAGELPTRLYKRLQALLPGDPARYTIMIASTSPGSTYWTLTERPAVAIFSPRANELRAHVYALDLKTLPQKPMARKQTQFLTPQELDRYAYGMLERTARGLSLDQLVLGLTDAFALKPTSEPLPEEDLFGERPFEAERHGIATADPPGLPADPATTPAAQALLATLTDRQRDVLTALPALADGELTQRALAERLGCSPGSIDSDRGAIASALAGCAEPEQQIEVLRQALDLIDGRTT